MFSSNALDVMRRGQAVPGEKVARLDGLVGAKTIALTHYPVSADQVSPPADVAADAPRPLAQWATTRAALGEVFSDTGTPSSRVVLVTDLSMEREWVSAGRMAGALSTESFFAP